MIQPPVPAREDSNQPVQLFKKSGRNNHADNFETASKPFITIDDLKEKALLISAGFDELLQGLAQLGSYKHPLAVRRGIEKGVSAKMSKDEKSRTLKAAGKTFFFDILKAKNGNSYLKIAESRFKGKEKEGTRNTLIVFPEDAQDFADAVSDMVSMLVQ